MYQMDANLWIPNLNKHYYIKTLKTFTSEKKKTNGNFKLNFHYLKMIYTYFEIKNKNSLRDKGKKNRK